MASCQPEYNRQPPSQNPPTAIVFPVQIKVRRQNREFKKEDSNWSSKLARVTSDIRASPNKTKFLCFSSSLWKHFLFQIGKLLTIICFASGASSILKRLYSYGFDILSDFFYQVEKYIFMSGDLRHTCDILFYHLHNF